MCAVSRSAANVMNGRILVNDTMHITGDTRQGADFIHYPAFCCGWRSPLQPTAFNRLSFCSFRAVFLSFSLLFILFGSPVWVRELFALAGNGPRLIFTLLVVVTL